MRGVKIAMCGWAKVLTVLALGAAWEAETRPVRAGEPAAAPGKFREPFRGALGPGWTWLREERNAWRVGPGGLEIRVLPGNMWGGKNDARNVLVRPVPNPEFAAVTVSLALENAPTEQYEQVDLVWYYDDGHMVKIGQELVNGKLSLVMGREENDKTRTIAILPLAPGPLEVRLCARGKTVQGFFRPSGAPEWIPAGTCDLPINGDPKISVQCYQGPAGIEHWARLRELTIATGKP